MKLERTSKHLKLVQVLLKNKFRSCKIAQIISKLLKCHEQYKAPTLLQIQFNIIYAQECMHYKFWIEGTFLMIIDSLIHLFIYFMLLSNLKKLSSIPYVTFKRSSSEIKTDEIFFYYLLIQHLLLILFQKMFILETYRIRWKHIIN